MPFFSNFGNKKKSKSSLSLAGAAGRRDQWGEDGSHSLDRGAGGGHGQLQDQKILAKLERINTDLEDRNLNLEEENNMLKIKVNLINVKVEGLTLDWIT